jgi:hypothetical protein
VLLLLEEEKFWRERLCARRSWARLLWERALEGMAGMGSLVSSLTCWRLAVDADFFSVFPGVEK